MANETTPKTLQEAIVYFNDPQNCLDYLTARRWPDGAICPTCGRNDVRYLVNQKKWQCKSVHKQRQFSVKVGTIFEDSPLGLDKWLMAVWMITSCKNGVSSYEVHRAIGVTQKTAWFMVHRIRLAMQTGSFAKKLSGEVEVDETFIGGKARNMHKGVRSRRIRAGGGFTGKAAVIGLLERHGDVRTMVVPNIRINSLVPQVKNHVESGSQVFTDALKSYELLDIDYKPQGDQSR